MSTVDPHELLPEVVEVTARGAEQLLYSIDVPVGREEINAYLSADVPTGWIALLPVENWEPAEPEAPISSEYPGLRLLAGFDSPETRILESEHYAALKLVVGGLGRALETMQGSYSLPDGAEFPGLNVRELTDATRSGSQQYQVGEFVAHLINNAIEGTQSILLQRREDNIAYGEDAIRYEAGDSVYEHSEAATRNWRIVIDRDFEPGSLTEPPIEQVLAWLGFAAYNLNRLVFNQDEAAPN